jgi:apolipoprotein N-acyltransferase
MRLLILQGDAMQTPVITRGDDAATKANSALLDSANASNKIVAPIQLRLLGLALASGCMLWLCHFPVAWGWLGWVALVPLLPLLRVSIRARWRYLCTWLAGTAYFWPALSWMTVADTRMIACWAMLSLYCSLYFPLAIFLVRWLDNRTQLPLVLTFPAVWTGLEFFRCFFGTGFSWYLLAHTQHDALHVIQIADLGGAFAVSFLVASVNVVIFECLLLSSRTRGWLGMTEKPRAGKTFAFQLLFVVALLGGTFGYGAWRLSHDDFGAGPRIALLQGNLDQRLRIQAHTSIEAQAKVQAAYIDLCRQAAKIEPRPQLIVWPETSYPVIWLTVAPHIDLTRLPAKFREDLALQQEAVRMVGPIAQTNVLLGLNTTVLHENKQRLYNSALLVQANGDDLQRYDKIHRILFGEYVPLRDWLPFMDRFAPYDFDYSISCGDGLTRLTLGNYRFGVLICYEDTDPFMARDYGTTTVDGPPVDFLLNISNDGWFNGSSEHEEHLAISRFRAIETRRALARSVNMGISAVIDGNGRIVAPVKHNLPATGPAEFWNVLKSEGRHHDLATDAWRQYKQTEGILVVDVPIDTRSSLYATYGDWLPCSCWLFIGCGLVWGFRGRSRLPSVTGATSGSGPARQTGPG